MTTAPRAASRASWLFLVCAALFVAGIGFVIAGERARREAARAEAVRPSGTPVANIRQLMEGLVVPNAAKIYDAVGFVSDASGTKETVPSSDAEWQAIATSALMLIEAGNLMLLGDRAIDSSAWANHTRRFMDKAAAAQKAAEAKSVDGIFAAGSDLNETCDACHQRYSR